MEMVYGWPGVRARRPRRSLSTWDWWTSGRLICWYRKASTQPHRFHPHGHPHPARHPGRCSRPDSGPAHPDSGQLSLHPPRPGGDPRRRTDDPYPGARAGEHRRRCLSPAGPGHDCLSGGARRLPGPRRGEGRPGAPHRLRLRDRDHDGCPDRGPRNVSRPASRPEDSTEGTPP